jgi:hypothetical protein
MITRFGSVTSQKRFVVHDSFNRADGSLGTADSGQLWISGGLSGTFSILGNVARATATSHNYLQGVSDGEISATIVTKHNLSGITFREVDYQNTFRLICNYERWDLQKRVSGATTTLAEIPGAASGDVLRVSMRGDTINVYVNGSLKATVTDTYNLTETSCGLYNGESGTFEIDEFFVEA